MSKRINKAVSCLLVLIMLGSGLPTAVGVSAAIPQMQQKDGAFSIEAEEVNINNNFEIVDDSAMSGGKGVRTQTDDKEQPAAADPGDLEFSFKPAAAGTYYLWARVNPSTVSKSIWLSEGGSDYKNVALKTNADELLWLKLDQIEVETAGADVLVKIRTRLGFFKLDKFIISADAAKMPEGNGTMITGTPATPSPTPSPTPFASDPELAKREAVFETKDGTARFEAEDIRVNANYKVVSVPEMSGGKGLSCPVQGAGYVSDPALPADIEFSFKADAAGTYKIWARVRPSTSSKSVLVSVNHEKYFRVALGGVAKEFLWVNFSKVMNVKAGDTVSVRIITQSGYFELDNFVVTNAVNSAPEGMEGNLVKTDTTLPSNLYPAPSVLPPAGHPRLYFTKDDIPRIRENMNKPQNAGALAKHESQLLDSAVDTLPPLAGTLNASAAVLSVIESRAFDYVIRGNEEAGKRAVAAMRKYVDEAVFPMGEFNDAGMALFTVAEVYDWCYPLLTAEDKSVFNEYVAPITINMDLGWPPTLQSAVGSHATECKFQRDLMGAAIAMYDERPDIYLTVAGRFFKEFVPAKKFLYQAHMNMMGDHYTFYRGDFEILATALMDAIGAPQVYGADQQYWPYWTLYARRPDGQVLRDGDTARHNDPIGTYNKDYYRMMLDTGNYFNDAYLKQEGMRELPNLTMKNMNSNHVMSCVEFLILNNPDLEGRPVDELPLTKYFPEPKGGMIARTGWEDGFDSPAVVAEMKINKYWLSDHQHLDAGAFQIYYKGALATDTGYYKAAPKQNITDPNNGNSDYGSLHYYNYHRRSVAHNVMLVYDPNEPSANFGGYANDGGQRMNTGLPMTVEEIIDPAGNHQVGKILGHEFGEDPMAPDYTYLKGDLTKAYSDKITGYERSFMFLNLKNQEHPAAMLVFDRVVSSNESFKKSWLLHGVQEPAINGSQTVFKDTREGYNGKLTVDTLLPRADNLTITPIGGPDKEFWVQDTNFFAIPYKSGNNEGSGWRIEVSPKNPSKTDYFLNVLQMGDANPDMPALPVTAIEGDKVVGARIADRVVLFGRERDRTKDEVAFSFAGDGGFEITVADLEKGTWQVTRDGADLTRASATEEGGVIVFRGGAGAYKLTYLNSDVNRPVISPVKPQLEGIGISVNNRLIYTDVAPTIRDDRTLVPMRAIFEKLGVNVTYDDATATATAAKDGREVKITRDSKTAYIDGQPVELDVPATIINDRFLVPVRFVSEAFYAKVEWDGFAKIVYITPGAIPGSSASGSNGGGIAIKGCEWSDAFEDGGASTYDNNDQTGWATQGVNGHWIIYDLGETTELKGASIMWNKGDEREAIFNVEVSNDNLTWTQVYDGRASGKVLRTFEDFMFPAGTKARYVKINCKGNNINDWNAILEIKFIKP